MYVYLCDVFGRFLTSHAAHSQPQVVANPARVATIRSDLSSLTGSAITLSFSVPVSIGLCFSECPNFPVELREDIREYDICFGQDEAK